MGDNPDSGDTGWQPPANPAQPPWPSQSPPPGLPSSGPGYARPGGIVGEARGVQARSEQDLLTPQRQFTVLTFRVERFDRAGNRLPPVAVQMRGRTFEGAISEGDWVEVEVAVAGAPSDTLHVDRVRNLTTTAVVRAKGEERSLSFWVVVGVVVLIVVVIFVVAIMIITSIARGFPAVV